MLGAIWKKQRQSRKLSGAVGRTELFGQLLKFNIEIIRNLTSQLELTAQDAISLCCCCQSNLVGVAVCNTARSMVGIFDRLRWK